MKVVSCLFIIFQGTCIVHIWYIYLYIYILHKLFYARLTVRMLQAVAANCSAVREWDSNGTVFGFNDKLPGHQAGEFGHNDFYPVCIAASEAAGVPADGKYASLAFWLFLGD